MGHEANLEELAAGSADASAQFIRLETISKEVSSQARQGRTWHRINEHIILSQHFGKNATFICRASNYR